MNYRHYPVMHEEVTGVFQGTDGKCFLDCTLGMGGHTARLLEHFREASAIGIDLDEESLGVARENLRQYGKRVRFHQMDFTEAPDRLALEIPGLSGVLLDPGISTYQLSEDHRGFSHQSDGPLDMRKNTSGQLTAAQIINGYPFKDLVDIFRNYGELNKPEGLARKIIERRLFKPVSTCGELRTLVEEYFRWKPRKGSGTPAALVFQALRIAVNRELDGLQEFIRRMVQLLSAGARMALLSFHSLEDRIFKKTLMDLKRESRVQLIKPFPIFPSPEEIEVNPASRSAKLRALEVL